MNKPSFPKSFLWGAATSSHQVEGNNHNDWSEWEKSPERIADLKKRGLNPEEFISVKACDHYNRFREDFDIAKQLGHNAHRFSIEWSRIEPEEGKFDEREIEHYREVIKALRERGMEPFVTLWHWTVPAWFQKRGGWLHAKSSESFCRFVEKISTELGDGVQFWCTLNEPVVFTSYAYIIGARPPQVKSIWQAAKVFHRLAMTHRQAYRVLHVVANANNRTCMVGIAKHNKYFISADQFLKNRVFAGLAKFFWNDAFMLHVRGYQDYIGLNYYNEDKIRFDRHAPYAGLYNLSNSPEGFFQTIFAMARYKKPIYVLENGLDDSTDTERPTFIHEHIDALQMALQNGADVRGYFHWSLLDNFEWESGFKPRFGLVEINYKTMERKIRPSALVYKDTIAKNREL